jgi:chromosome segregation ATPase
MMAVFEKSELPDLSYRFVAEYQRLERELDSLKLKELDAEIEASAELKATNRKLAEQNDRLQQEIESHEKKHEQQLEEKGEYERRLKVLDDKLAGYEADLSKWKKLHGSLEKLYREEADMVNRLKVRKAEIEHGIKKQEEELERLRKKVVKEREAYYRGFRGSDETTK